MSWKSINPLIAFNDPIAIWNNSPANVILELQFIILFLMSAYDAFSKQKNKMYRVAWFSALFSGIIIELFTILPQSIGNFYHSQFIIMLFGYREPFYMLPGLYVFFIYTFTTIVWHLNWQNKLSEYFFTVIIMYYVWQPLDLIGIHFNFWTWHNNEPLYNDRGGGVPCASTFWLMSFVSGVQFCLRCIKDHYILSNQINWYRVSTLKCIILAIIVSIFSIFVVMLIPFIFIYHPISNKDFGAGYHANVALKTYLIIAIVYVCYQIIKYRDYLNIKFSNNIITTLIIQIFIVYIIGSLIMMHCIDIGGGIKQISYHQPLSITGNQIIEDSFFGLFQRNKYVVNNEIDIKRDHYTLECYDYKTEFEGTSITSLEWYGLCGTGLEKKWIIHFDTMMWVGGVLSFLSQIVQFSIVRQTIPAKKYK